MEKRYASEQLYIFMLKLTPNCSLKADLHHGTAVQGLNNLESTYEVVCQFIKAFTLRTGGGHAFSTRGHHER